MKKIIFKYLGLASIVISALAIWFLANRLFSVSYLNNWGWIIFFIAIFFITWSLGAIIIRDKRIFLGATFLGLATQLIFVWHWGLLLIVIVSFLALWLGRKVIRNEMRNRIKIDIWNYLRVSRRLFIFAIALMLAGQYYFFTNPQIESNNLPKFSVNARQDGLLINVMSIVDPDLFNQNGELSTVDEFVFQKFKKDNLYNVDKIDDFQKENILNEGRSSVSKMTERTVGGEEKMMNVFVEILNKKVDDFLSLNTGYLDQDMPVMHLVFTLIIFLTVSTTGMILSLFLILLVGIIFKLLVLVGLLSIDKKAVNMEIVQMG